MIFSVPSKGWYMRKALTDKALDALKPQAKRYEVHDTYCPGLSVRVTPEGKNSSIIVSRCAASHSSG